MFKNYWKVAIRSLLKRKVYTSINILGLAAGMAVCLLIVLFIRSETNYDTFEPNSDRIVRVVLDRKYPGRTTGYAEIPFSVGQAIAHEFPEVAACTGLQNFVGNGSVFMKVGEKVFEEKRVFFADSNFFRVFSSGLLEGDTATALARPNTAVLDEQTAIRYYGTASAARPSD